MLPSRRSRKMDWIRSEVLLASTPGPFRRFNLISAETEQTAQRDRALAELEHGERVRSRVEQVVIKAVPDQGRRRGLGLRRAVGGNEEKDRGYKPDLYCSSQLCHNFTFCSR